MAGSIDRLRSHASGIIISTAWGSDRPPRCSSSSTSSKLAVSDPPGVQIGKIRSRSPGMRSDASSASRARIQFRLPCTVLISPLWARYRYGWASGHDGNVLVENRLCTSASADSSRSSSRSGKKPRSCPVVSIPL